MSTTDDLRDMLRDRNIDLRRVIHKHREIQDALNKALAEAEIIRRAYAAVDDSEDGAGHIKDGNELAVEALRALWPTPEDGASDGLG